MMERRPCKRRKLSSASSATTDSTCVPQRLSPDAFPQSSVSDGVGGETTSTSCVTCHHSLLGKPNHVVICPRCKSTSCSICSRICTAVPGSLPPTPLLTYSPSPSPPGTPYLNSETPYLAFSMSSFRSGTPSFSGDQHHHHHHQGTGSGSTSGMGRVQQVQSRRRKFRDDEDEDDEGETVVGVDDDGDDGYEYGFGGLDDAQMWNGAKRHKQLRGSNGDGRGRDEILPGCGRSICKNCCIENTQSGITTCYDCYGLPSPVQIVGSNSTSSISTSTSEAFDPYSNFPSNSSSSISLVIQ